MEKIDFRTNVWVHLVLLVILPPVGLYFFWKSRRNLWIKTWASIAALLIMGFLVLGIYGKIEQSRVPASGYDISIDNLGRYRTPRVLDFEKKIFDEVVMEKKQNAKRTIPLVEGYEYEPFALEFQLVAGKNNISYSDVRGIYYKVSALLLSEIK